MTAAASRASKQPLPRQHRHTGLRKQAGQFTDHPMVPVKMMKASVIRQGFPLVPSACFPYILGP